MSLHDRETLKQQKVKELREAHKALTDMQKRHLQIATMMQSKAVERLQTLDVATLTPRKLADWFEVSVKVERLSRGEATEITDERASLHKKRDQMTEDEIREYIVQRQREIGRRIDEPVLPVA